MRSPHSGIRLAGLGITFTLVPSLTLSTALAGDGGTLHEIQLIGVEFQPAEIDVAPGDTVRFMRITGSHTATSGADCVYDELYFDHVLNAADPVFDWVVPSDLSGPVPYFCRPHCSLFDMYGTITVMGTTTCPSDLTGDEVVGFDDLLEVLSNWGPCPGCAQDVDQDDVVGFSDLLMILSNWGPC